MSSTTVDIDAGRIEKIELGQLAISPLNVRKNAEVGPEDELVASIRAHGLLQPLVGYMAKSGMATVLICAGQRRLLALQHVAKPETKIPVRIIDEETAIEVSLAENLERKNMNPVDEFAAFKALIDTGHYDADRIASRFGFALNLVKRRLKMATLISEVLEAVREGAITLEAAEAYAAASEEVQRDVFKKHNAKGAWEPHQAERVRSDIVLHGLSANSRVGKFIGGMEAYRAAGGTVIDEAFIDLFKKDDDDGRMRDVTIVRQLVETRKAELADETAALVKKKYPFATGYEWAEVFGAWGPDYPKPGKKSGLVLIGRDYNQHDAKDMAKRAKEAAKDHSANVLAIVAIDPDGQPYVWEGKFLIGKGGWDQVKPEERSTPGYQQLTPEERAAQERERKIRAQACGLFGRSLIGERPGFRVTHCSVDGWGPDRGSVLSLTLQMVDVPDEYIDRTGYQHRLSADAVQPFIEEATKIVDGAEAKEKAQAVNFEDQLARLEKLPIAKWPAVTVVNVAMGADNGQLIITPIAENGCHLLNLVDAIELPSTSEDPAFTVEVIRDQTRDYTATISTYDSIEAFSAEHAGTCRICACTEPCACEESDRDPDWHGPCAWADATKTLCSNPDCLAKAGVQVPEAAEENEPEAVA